jgi:AcrR family transcriptional regulator
VSASTKTATRRRNPRGQGDRLRDALLDAAIELLADLQDVEALSVRAVTAHVGVTPTALYLHFSDKEDLLAAVKERCFGELHRYVLAGEQEAGADPRSQAEAMCSAYLRFAAERPGYYRVLFHTPRGEVRAEWESDPMSVAELEWPPGAADALGDLVRAVARCLPPNTPAQPVATMVWAGLHGYVGLRSSIRHYPFPDGADYIRRLLDAQLGAAAITRSGESRR